MVNQFSRLIILLRNEKKLSQKKAAEQLNISQALLSHYEKGIRECGLDFLIKAADFYGVSADYLLGRTTERTGAVITAQELPDENSAGKENTMTAAGMLPVLNKRILIGSLNVIFDMLAKTGDKELLTEVSSHIMLSVYKCFRYVYSIENTDGRALFAAEDATFSELVTAAQQICEAKIKCKTGAARSIKVKAIKLPEGALASTQLDLESEYSNYSATILNLIKTCEVKMDVRA